MSSQTIVLNTGQQAIITTDVSRIFIWENRYAKGNYTNSGYDDLQINAGTLLGRVAATQELIPHNSSATDGSQYPVGVLAEDTIVEAGETKELYFCNYGDVVEDKVLLADGDDLDTLIEDRSIRDRIAADTVGIRLVPSTEMTEDDNS
jgi:hypothetical protein